MQLITWFILFTMCNAQQEKTKISKALHKLFDFLFEDQNLNLDGLFGIVMAEALLESALDFAHDPKDKSSLNGLSKKAYEIIQAVFPMLPQKSEKYAILKKLLDVNLWHKNVSFANGRLDSNVNKDIQFVNFHQYYQYTKGSIISEEFSDMCIIDLLQASENIKRPLCNVSRICLEVLVNSSVTDPGYGQTHRLLYLQIARARHCFLDQVQLSKIITKYCSYILWEVKQGKRFQKTTFLLDLFLEQTLVCGYEGYAEFLTEDSFDLILRSQNDRGCYKESHKFKREAHVIRYGCTDHATGLAAADLSLFYYYFVKNHTTPKGKTRNLHLQ